MEGFDLPRVEPGGVPGPDSRALMERLRAVESRNVTFRSEDFPVFWERARGANVWDADGNRFVDLTAAFAVAGVGHRHPRVAAALRRQSERLLHGMGDVHPPSVKVELMERLAAVTPLEDPRVVLGSSGSDAVEVALKTARLHTGRPGVICFTGAYHGLSYGALSVTDRDHFREPFEDQLNPHVWRAPYPHPFRPHRELLQAARPEKGDAGDAERRGAALRDAALEKLGALLSRHPVGAVLVEPLQGRGGEVVPPEGFLAGLRRLCDEHGALLVADEIYTGLGRTGGWFACQAEGVIPDLLCVGKALTSCLPLSACVGRREVMDAWPPSEGEAIHTSTFLGNPLACAAGIAALAVLEEGGLPGRARAAGRRWRDLLAELLSEVSGVGEVRGRGLMVGVDLVDPERGDRAPDGARAARAAAEALRRGWIVLPGGPAGNVLSLTPPLNAPEDLLEAGARTLAEVLTDLR